MNKIIKNRLYSVYQIKERHGISVKRFFLLTVGIVLWIGAVSPEIFAEPGMGCLGREDGQPITKEESEQVWWSLLYPGYSASNEDSSSQVVYKSRLLKWLEDLDI